MRERDDAIDLMKCLAVLCIFNAHSTMLYPIWPWLSTGGYIGDALFFFCSGYTLFIDNGSHLCRFDNWYKRRLVRIWPSCIAWGLVAGLFSLKNITIVSAFQGIEWFMRWILIYYAVLWCIGKWLIGHLWKVFFISLVFSFGLLFYMEFTSCTGYWGPAYFFPVMVFGTIIGVENKAKLRCNMFWRNLCGSLFFFLLFTGLIAFGTRLTSLKWAHYVPVFCSPLLVSFCWFVYLTFNSDMITRFRKKRWFWNPIMWIGGLCMDFYLVKATFISDELNSVFPLNLPIMLIYLMSIAYLLRCVGRIFQQTISPGEYNWRAVIKL